MRPAGMSRSMWSTAVFAPKRRVRPRAEMASSFTGDLERDVDGNAGGQAGRIGICSVEHDLGHETELRAVGRGQRVVRRELRFAADETHLALEGALQAIDVHGGRRARL